MGVLDNSNALALEMEKVVADVPVLFDRDDTFFSQIEKGEVEVISKRDMRIPLEIAPGGKFGYYDTDGGDLGLGGAPQFDKAVINTLDLRHAVQWTTQAAFGTDDSRKSVANAFKRIFASAMPEFRRNVDSLCLGDGTGVLGTISAVSTSAGVDTYTLGTDGFGARLLRQGQNINVYNSTVATNRTSSSEREITFLDLANKQIKVAAVTGATATDKLVSSGLSGANPIGIYGIPYHNNSATSGTWLGFTRSATPAIVGNSVNAASGALALPFPRLAINKIGDRIGQDQRGTPLLAWMHPCQQQAYEQLGQLVTIINQTNASQEGLDLYFNNNRMQMAGAPVRTHYSWDKTRVDFLNMKTWRRAELTPAGFYEVGGTRIFEGRGPSGGVAAYQFFYLKCSFNLFCLNPAANSYVSSLAVPSGY